MANKVIKTQVPLTDEQAEKIQRVIVNLEEIQETFQTLGIIPMCPEVYKLVLALDRFGNAAVAAIYPPKKPRKPRRVKSSPVAGWVGC